MLSANKEKLQSFFMGFNQYKIPFFQRAYVWKTDNWSELWDNVLEELSDLENNVFSEHFIGTIIIKQTATERLGAVVYDLVDGQQRLTTLCLLLRALHDSTEDINLKNWISSLLVFTDAYGTKNTRIIHSKVDSEYFQRLLLSDYNNTGITLINNRIIECYLYFKDAIKKIDVSKISNIVIILLERLPVIHMALSKEDDVQQIFDTINSLGVKLTTGELLKNYLFSFKELEPYYAPYWQSVFESDEDAIQFWEKDKTAGRVVRSTVELFLYSYLVILKEGTIKLESLFKEYKEYLKSMEPAEKLGFAKELHEYAKIYEQLPEGENIAEIMYGEHAKRFFHLINELDISTVLPLVLFIYKIIGDTSEREKILRSLESYLMRRTICRLTTKNYNNLFISLLVDLKRLENFTADDFHAKLLSFSDDSNRFPTDEELRIAFSSSQLINQYAKEVLYCIALYDLNNQFNDIHRLNSSGFSVEHIMPKKWRNHWSSPVLNDDRLRDSKLLTLGNLTLVKGKLNSSMRDGDWIKKKDALTKFSSLRITTDYLGNSVWDEQSIDKRANDLLAKALNIWSR